MSWFVVATNGTGLYIREETKCSTTVYRDRTIAEFDTYEEADEFCNRNDQFYYED